MSWNLRGNATLKDMEGGKMDVDGGKKRQNLWTYQCPPCWMTWQMILTFPICPTVFSGTELTQRIKSHHFAVTDVQQQLQNFCMRKQAFTDLCDKPAQSFGTTYHEWQRPYWPERQAAIWKLATQDCYESVANHQVNCQTTRWGWSVAVLLWKLFIHWLSAARTYMK